MLSGGGRTAPDEEAVKLDPAGALPTEVMDGEVVDPFPLLVGLLVLFLEERVPPTAPPTTAPITIIAAISTKILHFF